MLFPATFISMSEKIGVGLEKQAPNFYWMDFPFFFKKNLSFKIAMSWRASSGRASIGHHPRFTFWLTLFFKVVCYLQTILQWIAFIFGRDEEVDP